jgi:phasin family protein
MSESANNTQALMSVKDAQELLTLQASLMQPLAEKTVAYSRHLYDIASGTSAEFSKAAEEQATDAQKKFMSVVDNAAKNAPAGSESAVAVMKSAVSAANNAMESVQKAVKQATEMAESNFNTVTSQAVTATKAAAKKR